MQSEEKMHAQANFKKDFIRLINNATFGTTMENFKNYRGIKLAITEARRNYLVSEPNYHTTIFFR